MRSTHVYWVIGIPYEPIIIALLYKVPDAACIFTPQLAGEARQLGCPKIVLDHMRVLYIYIYICLCAPQCLSTHCIGIGDALATGIQAPAGTCKLMNIAICNRNKLYKVPDAACIPNIN